MVEAYRDEQAEAAREKARLADRKAEAKRRRDARRSCRSGRPRGVEPRLFLHYNIWGKGMPPFFFFPHCNQELQHNLTNQYSQNKETEKGAVK